MSATLIPDMPFADYLAHPALSASGMKRLLDCPARFRHEQAQLKAPSPSMLLGSLIHHMVLGSDVEYVAKDWDARTNEGKERAAEVSATGAVVVTAAQWVTAENVAAAIWAHPTAKRLLTSGATEQTIIWTDAATGVELKCRLDVLPDDGRLVPDLKTARNARPDKFARDEADYGYAIQRAQQIEAVRSLGLYDAPESVLVAVETDAPHLVSLVGLSDSDILLARGLREKAIRLYAECAAADHWPGYPDSITYPDAPIWWRLQAEESLGLTSEIEV